MKRSYPLRVDRLEDRCVPNADMTGVEPPADPTQPDDTQFVIDVYLVDPDAPPPPVKTDSNPEGWTPPEEIVPPVGDPFWY